MAWLLAVSMLLVVAFFWHEEWKRESLLRFYQAPSFYLNMLGSIKGTHKLKVLMNDDEVIACFLSQRTLGNLDLSPIKAALSGIQITSAQNIVLPSPDSDGHYWYVLFFTREKVSRIYLIDENDVHFQLANIDSGCAKSTVKFFIERKGSEVGKRGLVTTFEMGE